MIIKLDTLRTFYTKKESDKLSKLGFSFVPREYNSPDMNNYRMVEAFVDINLSSLEELFAFEKEYGDLIVSNGNITIYDGYNE